MQGFGGQDASTESINVLFCLFVCPQSPRKPQGENENGGRERMRISEEMMMRKKHQRKLLKIQYDNCLVLQCSKHIYINAIYFVYETIHIMCLTAKQIYSKIFSQSR